MADSSDAVIIDITAKFTDQTSPAIESTQKKLSGVMATIQKLQETLDRLNGSSGSQAAFEKARADADRLDTSTQKVVQDTDKLGQTKASDSMFTGAENSASKFTQAVEKSKKSLDDLGRKRAQPEVSLKDTASKVLKDIGSGVKTVADKTFSFTVKAIDLATKPLRSIFNFATSLKGIITGIATGAAVKGTILDPISLADQYKNAEIGFDTMLGSVQKGQQMMSSIQKFAIATPFSTSDVVKNTQTMMAYGFQAKDVIKDMQIIGDQSAATGRGSAGLQEISLALGQMMAHGKVDAQDMNQLTSAGVKGWDYLAAAMHKTKGEVMKMAEDPKGSGISADFGVQALLNGMKEYNGMMDKMANTTATGLLSQIKDTFSIDILTKWGQGLQKGVVGSLSKFSDWLGKNQDKIAKWGDALEAVGATISQKVTSKVEALGDRINGVVNSDAFQKAGSLSDKIHILWDQVIVQPFDKWWNTSGQKWMAGKAAGIGRGLGSAMTGGLLALLGVTNPDATSGGASIGGSFAKGFSETFNGKKIADAFIKDFKSILSDAGKLLPGGKSPTSTSWISAAALAYGGYKVAKPVVAAGKGIGKFGKDVGGLAGAVKKHFSKGAAVAAEDVASSAAGALATETMTVNAAVVNLNSDLFKGSGSGASKDLKNAESEVASNGPMILDDAKGASKKLSSATKGEVAAGEALEDGQKAEKGIGGFFKRLFSGKSGATRAASEAGEAAEDVGKLGKFASFAGKFGKAAPVIGTVLAVAGGAAEIASASKKDRAKTAVGVGGNIAGGLAGAAAGSKLGAMAGGAIGSIIPGAGTAAGAAIGGGVGAVAGGIAGAIGGEKVAKGIYSKKNDIGKGISAAGKAVGNFFTKTIPGAASSAAKSAGNFVTKTIPSAASKAGNAIGGFFTKTLPYNAGKAAGTAAAFVTKTVPKAASAAGNAVGGFFTKTLPSAASKAADSVGTFVTKTVPSAASTAGNAVGGFFTKTLPSAASKAASAVGNFVTKTVPGAATTAGNAVGGFFTKTLPSAASQVASSAGDFITKTIPSAVGSIGNAVGGFFTKTIPNAVSSAFDSAKKFFQTGWNNFTKGFNAGYSAHASGGIFSKPHVGLVAEAGPEAIIPLSDARRARGMELWQQAGKALGVHPYADGGIVGQLAPVIPISSARKQTADVQVTPTITIKIDKIEFSGTSGSGNPSEEDKEQLANDLAMRTAKALEKIFPNIPIGA